MSEPRITVGHAAAVLGLRWARTKKILTRLAVIYPPDSEGLYDARILDLCRALRAQPHRALEPVEIDWLARYMKEHHAPKESR